MGISAGAIYKWEQAISTPDIEVIMEIASFFDVSVDALIGYKMCKSDRERILASLQKIRLEKGYENCWDEVESWLRRYPNDFEIVYEGGTLYNRAGIETGDHTQLFLSIELLTHACTLISQNRDSKLSETELHRDIAIAYLVMGKCEEGIDRLKKNNPCGVYDDIIGQEFATNPQKRHEAAPYLTNSLLHCTASLHRIVIGFVNLFFAQKDYHSAIDILCWMTGYLDGLRTKQGVSYLDKDNALLLALCGAVYNKVGATKEAKEFNAAPNYTGRNIRYCEQADLRAAYDNLGSTAMDSILKILHEGVDGSAESVLDLWEEICNEV